tara:strand:+ start:189 stop:1013 length:825 start_codon:yes stop_codon:yes gene_type:complete
MFRQIEPLNNSKQKKLLELREIVKSQKKVCVAFSGGVDSSLVAAIAHEQLGNNAIAVTGVSPALAPSLREEAQIQARWIGIKHEECFTEELKNPNYRNNPKDRCYSCKQELHSKLKNIFIREKDYKILDGVNHDDLKDYRPGIQAAKESGVFSPLAEVKLDKITIREISRAIGLPWWDKPAQPCLASRFPYGESINSQNLAKVGRAEEWLRNRGFAELRVRSQGLSACIEVPIKEIHKIIKDDLRTELVTHFLSIGFKSISIDLEGLISGKLNR